MFWIFFVINRRPISLTPILCWISWNIPACWKPWRSERLDSLFAEPLRIFTAGQKIYKKYKKNCISFLCFKKGLLHRWWQFSASFLWLEIETFLNRFDHISDSLLQGCYLCAFASTRINKKICIGVILVIKLAFEIKR